MFNQIDKKMYLLDSTVISLCIKVFDWGTYRKQKGAIKLHTLLDDEPTNLFMTKGSQADVKLWTIASHSVVVADRAYEDFKMLYSWDKKDVDFVLRLKKAINYISVLERELPEDNEQNILVDEEIELKQEKTRENYPKKLRRIALFDKKSNRTIELTLVGQHLRLQSYINRDGR